MWYLPNDQKRREQKGEMKESMTPVGLKERFGTGKERGL